MTIRYILCFLLILFVAACKRNIDDVRPAVNAGSRHGKVLPPGFFVDNVRVPGGAPNAQIGPLGRTANTPDPNNGDLPVILGPKLNNPYSVAHMQQAVDLMYGGHYPISATHLYVRFKPADADQFNVLEDIEDLELQDYPMDHEVIQEGDYYQDSTLTMEEFGWLYTVLPVHYTFPGGIQYQIVDQLYLPEGDDLFLEQLAESMASGASYQSSYSSETGLVSIHRTDVMTGTYEYPRTACDCADPTLECLPEPGCDPNPGGGGGGPSNSDRVPRGKIEVQEFISCGSAPTNVAVRNARVVCKRWFKIERIYTNNQGQFFSTKHFLNRVKVIVKSKNNHGSIRKIRGIRIWQTLFPVRERIGIFDRGEMAAIAHVFERPSTDGRLLPQWVAFTTHNSLMEFRDYATQLGFAHPPDKMKILLSNWGSFEQRGTAPMLNKCGASLTTEISTAYISAAIPFGMLVNILSRQVDVVIGYKRNDGNYCNLSSADVKEVAYHELGHASHYAQVGCDFWNQYRASIIRELSKVLQPENHPYGDGNDPFTAPIIALSEMWGYHIEYLLTDRYFGLSVPWARMQDDSYYSINGLGAYLVALESFKPNLITDVHRWIPNGLPYDLFDSGNEAVSGLRDNVSGYTTQQCFSALQSDVRSVPAFRNRLLSQNGNNQLNQVNILFQDYNY